MQLVVLAVTAGIIAAATDKRFYSRPFLTYDATISFPVQYECSEWAAMCALLRRACQAPTSPADLRVLSPSLTSGPPSYHTGWLW